MEAAALSDAAFPEFGKKVVLFCHITSRVSTDKHQDLLQKKGGRGFPHLTFMDADGEVLSGPRDRSVKGFEATLSSLAEWSALKKKADAGDKAAKAKLVIVELELGKSTLADAQAAIKEQGPLPKDLQARFDDAALNAEVSELMKGATNAEEASEVGRKFAEMKRQKRVPKGDVAVRFHSMIMQAADKDGDAKGYEAALGDLKKAAGDNPAYKAFIDRSEKRLAELKSGKPTTPPGGAKKSD